MPKACKALNRIEATAAGGHNAIVLCPPDTKYIYAQKCLDETVKVLFARRGVLFKDELPELGTKLRQIDDFGFYDSPSQT